MNTTENNKLIAEFMGLKDSQINSKGNGIEWVTQTKNLKYHSDWNWLIPAVTKCKESQIFGTQHYIDTIDEALIKLDIDALYDATVKFIEVLNYSKGCYKTAEKGK